MADRSTSSSNTPGISTAPKADWPAVAAPESSLGNYLKPGSPNHERVLSYLKARLDLSERAMSAFYSRWNYQEKRIQGYIKNSDYEALLKANNDSGEAPSVISLSIPYSYATVATIVTYLTQVFAGRRPLFDVRAGKGNATDAAASMQAILQYQADHEFLIKILIQSLFDGQVYGISALRTLWRDEVGMRTVWKDAPAQTGGLMGLLGKVGLGGPMDDNSAPKVKSREEHTIYSGNDISGIDPFLFFPDPRVPMSEVASKGEFVFWRDFKGVHELKGDGELWHVEHAGKLPNNADGSASASGDQYSQSARTLISGGNVNPNNERGGKSNAQIKDFIQIDEGTCIIIPRELGLSDSEKPEHWLFTIANKRQIIHAQPLEMDHGEHPVSVSEPYKLGYSFGSPGITDWIGPLQDTMSWLVNSHMANVRTAINNMWIVDPSRVEMQDLKKPGAGKIIRIKRAAYGQDIKALIHQLPVADVTRGHLDDLQTFMQIADSLSGVSENLKGLQAEGGRKTATEVRISSQAGASRLAALARLISAQQISPLTRQMSLNTQQYLDEEFELAVLGNDGRNKSVRISPEHVVGDFNYPVLDGTLPLDRVALLDVWQQILLGVAQDPELRRDFSLSAIFEYVAELGGANNIDEFKNVPEQSQGAGTDIQANVVPDAEIDAGVADGSLVPQSALAGGIGVEANPAERLIQGV